MARAKRPESSATPGPLNLGPKSTTWLQEIGVHSTSDLERLGVVVTYRILKDRFPGVSFNMLYALEGALTGRSWREITPDEKARLRQEADAVKRSAGGQSDAVEAYVAQCPPETQEILQTLRALIREVAPDVTEKISYGIPTFELNGKYVVYFGAWKKHIAFYPVTPELESSLGTEIAPYRSGKGTLRFPLGKPMPLELIRRIVALRVKEVRATK